MELLRKIDNRLLGLALWQYRKKGYEPSNKVHSFMTVMFAICFDQLVFRSLVSAPILPELYSQIFTIILTILLIWATIMSYLEWRLFFEYLKEGKSNAKNWFFHDSAGPGRKRIFYISLGFYIGVNSMLKFVPGLFVKGSLLVYALNCISFYAWILILLEFMRLVLKWDNRKHFKYAAVGLACVMFIFFLLTRIPQSVVL